MRPVRVEVEGFSAFRQRTVLDLADVELFALAGPTGSGKSSLIDAMVFALYGSIPRLDLRAVAPIISLGANEARVRLDFTVEGQDYTAVRIVRRTKNGATTKEARLERGGEVLAGNEKELSAAVEELLGLGVGEFTKCVVLPQGAFAEFLHAPGKTRQEILVKLLDLGVYEHMAHAAREHERAAKNAADYAEGALERLADATPETLAQAQARVTELAGLAAHIEAAGPETELLARTESEALAAAAEADRRVARLSGVRVPDGLHDQGRALAEAAGKATEATEAEDRAAAAADRAEELLAELPDRPSLEAAVEAHSMAIGHEEQRLKGEALLADRGAAVVACRAELEVAVQRAEAAREQLEHARWTHRARDLAGGLVVGEPCPVCLQRVESLPTHDGGDPVAVARQSQEAATVAEKVAAKALASAEGDQRGVELKLASIADQLDRLAPVLEAHPDPEALTDQLAHVRQAQEAEKALRSQASAARKASLAARREHELLAQRETSARRTFEQTRGELAAMGAPVSDQDLVVGWEALAQWAAAEVPVHQAAADAARDAARSATEERAKCEAEVLDRCRSAAVPAARPGRGRSTVVAARQATAEAAGRASAMVAEVERSLADADKHRGEALAQRQRADVAHELALHLSASRFEKWVLDDALASLVARATHLLVDLSDGAYSLTLDERSNFAVVDHRNADQVRSARTLSGGETFLASLALALGLADQIGELASRGSARLESIFLDEGFGTLDPDRLDTVACAIEELGSGGRMVGLVTHVEELAERVPVRFEVSNGPAGSSVERVSA